MISIGGATILTTALALATAGPAAAQQKKRAAQLTQAQQVEARHQCFLQAQAAVPGSSIGSGEVSQRTAIYTSCARRRGVRP